MLNKKKIQIISLGQNCIPRTILTRHGIKPRKIWGELTYPFDLAIFGTIEITKCLKTDFNEFFFDLNYKNDKKYWVKEPNCIQFVHDSKDKKELIKNYTKRIENFKKEMKNPLPILFVQLLEEDEDVKNLYNELLRLREDRPFKLLIIDTQDIVTFEKAEILKLPFPSVEYRNNWWKKEFYNSKEGKIFEKNICDFCKRFMVT